MTTEANLGTDLTEVETRKVVETSAGEVDGGVLGVIQPISTRVSGTAGGAGTVEEVIMARGGVVTADLLGRFEQNFGVSEGPLVGLEIGVRF